MTSYTPKSAYPYPDPTDAVTDYPATASTLAGYLDNLPNRNAIINGCFDIWQRNTAFENVITSGSYTADRWIIGYNGTGSLRNISRQTQALGTTIDGMQARYYYQVIVTNAGTATSQTIGQRVENVTTLAGETVTFSAYVKTGSGTMNLTAKAIQNFGTGGSPSSAVTTTLGTATATTTWTRIKFTATLPTLTGKTLGTALNDYLEVQFDLGSQTGTLNIWGVQLEQNSTATALERRPIQQELALCQRYFERISHSTSDVAVAVGNAYLATTFLGLLTYLPKRPSVPAISFVTSAAAYDLVGNGSVYGVSAGTLTGAFAGYSSAQIGCTITTAAPVGASMYLRLKANVYIDISAEL